MFASKLRVGNWITCPKSGAYPKAETPAGEFGDCGQLKDYLVISKMLMKRGDDLKLVDKQGRVAGG